MSVALQCRMPAIIARRVSIADMSENCLTYLYFRSSFYTTNSSR
jgi:hypothetical protein